MSEHKKALKQLNNDSVMLSVALIWWIRLTQLKKELFESKYGKIDDEKIIDIYKIHTNYMIELIELEQEPESCVITPELDEM